MYGKSMEKQQLVKRIAEEIMMRRGYGKYSRDHIEWDENEDDSQFSLVMEDVAQVLEILDAEGGLVDPETIE